MVTNVARVWSVGSMAVAALLLGGTPVWGADATPADAGKQYYKQYCASCHGPAGKGDGPMAGALKAKTPDLTQLAKKHGGKFPYMEVLDIIDGANTTIPSHGTSEMPAWGETFQSDVGGDPLQQAAVRGRLMLLTDYLRSIQQK